MKYAETQGKLSWNRVSRYGELRGLVMGAREIDRFLERWEMNVRDLHRLCFALKRPKKRLVKANESKRQAFVAEYAA